VQHLRGAEPLGPDVDGDTGVSSFVASVVGMSENPAANQFFRQPDEQQTQASKIAVPTPLA
jgi:hypothetical protein